MSSNGAVVEPNITIKFNSDTRQIQTFLHSPTSPIPYRLPGTNDEWRKFIDHYMPIQIPKPTPPEHCSQGTLALYKSAIKEPGSLTEEEVFTILEWVPAAWWIQGVARLAVPHGKSSSRTL